ncbi:MAG: response regulator [Candidatus Kapaibacterium sp.]
MKLWDKYVQYYLQNFSPSDVNKDAGLQYLRDKLFISILLISLPIGFIMSVSGIVASVASNQVIIGTYDAIAFLLVLFLFFYKNQSINSKKILYSINFYVVAVILFVFLGTKGPSVIILLCSSVLITLYQSKRAGLITVAINTFIFFVITAILPINSFDIKFFQEFTVASWLGISVNMAAFNALVVLSVSFLLNQLNESFIKEKTLQELLKTESSQLLSAKQRAEESDRLKSAFLANMSHEIRTPMNGILGFASLLGESDVSDKDQKEYIGIIQKSGERLLNLINDIVEISKIESGLMKVNIKRTNINEHIDYIFNILKSDAQNKDLILTFKKDLSEKDPEIYTDSDKLNAVLSNLVKNAIKYTDKGSVEFGYKIESSNDKNIPSSIKFFVKDTGIGIPKDRQKAIFERFIQADILDIQAREGVGLGLSIAKSFIELLKGKIWVESEIGKGSTFYFTIPCYSESPLNTNMKDNNIPDVKRQNTKKPNILIVEDDAASEKYITTLMKNISNKLYNVSSGKEAVELCRNSPDIDLILMDIRMPDINGHEVTKQIRHFNKDVIIIAQTAFGLEGDREKAINAGCNDYISKPIDKNQLLSLINKYSNI